MTTPPRKPHALGSEERASLHAVHSVHLHTTKQPSAPHTHGRLRRYQFFVLNTEYNKSTFIMHASPLLLSS